MGCFDVVCSVSNLPIREGDEIVVLYVGTQFHPVYGPAGYKPIMFPMFGTYNDYGDIEGINETGLAWRTCQTLMETSFKDVTLPTFRESTPFGVFKDTMVGRSNQVLPQHWIYTGLKAEFKLQEPRSYAPNQETYEMVKGNNSNAARMFIHRKIYDHICKTFHDSIIGYGEHAKQFSEYAADIPEYIRAVAVRERHLATLELIGRNTEERDRYLDEHGLTEMSLYDYHEVLTMHEEERFGLNARHPFGWIFSSSGDEKPIWGAAMWEYKKMLCKLCRKEDLSDAEEFMAAIVELYCFVQGMRMLNMDIVPFGGYAGEQHQYKEGCEQMIKLLELYIEIEKDKIKLFESWDEE